MNTESGQLVRFDQAMQALAEAETFDEVKEIRDKAEALRKYAQSAALGLDAQNYAAEVKLRAERKAGDLLATLQLRGGDRKSNHRNDRLTLSDLGISHNQSTRWQLEAKLPEKAFEQYLATARAAGKEIAASAVIRLARLAGSSNHNGDSGHKNGSSVVDRIGNGHTTPHGVDGLSEPRYELLMEISNHLGLLDDVLEPIYSGKKNVLEPGPRRVLKHLLTEVKSLLGQLQIDSR